MYAFYVRIIVNILYKWRGRTIESSYLLFINFKFDLKEKIMKTHNEMIDTLIKVAQINEQNTKNIVIMTIAVLISYD